MSFEYSPFAFSKLPAPPAPEEGCCCFAAASSSFIGEEAAGLWAREFGPSASDVLRFSARCAVLDHKEDVLSAQVFVSDRYLCLLVFARKSSSSSSPPHPCVVPLAQVASWCPALASDIAEPPYVRISRAQSLQQTPSAACIFTNQRRVHMLFRFEEEEEADGNNASAAQRFCAVMQSCWSAADQQLQQLSLPPPPPLQVWQRWAALLRCRADPPQIAVENLVDSALDPEHLNALSAEQLNALDALLVAAVHNVAQAKVNVAKMV